MSLEQRCHCHDGSALVAPIFSKAATRPAHCSCAAAEGVSARSGPDLIGRQSGGPEVFGVRLGVVSADLRF